MTERITVDRPFPVWQEVLLQWLCTDMVFLCFFSFFLGGGAYGSSDDSHFLDLKGSYFIWLHVPWLYDNGYHNPLP